jgi:hypothetical protein
MKSFFKFGIATLFLSLGLCVSSFAKISPIYFKGISDCFNGGMEAYSPTYGAMYLETGFLSNLRFYGAYNVTEKDGQRIYIDDQSSNPHFRVIHLFFPSPTGTLATETTHAQNLGKLFKGEKGIEAIAELLHYSFKVRENKGDKEQKRRESKVDKNQKGKDDALEQEVLTKLVELLGTEKKQFEFLLKEIKKAVVAEKQYQNKDDERSSSVSIDMIGSFFPSYTIDHILLAFFCQHYNTGEDVITLLKKLPDIFVDHSKLPQLPQTWTSVTVAPIFNKLDHVSLDEFFILTNLNFISGGLPYQEGDPISNGNTYYVDPRTGKYVTDRLTFADCVETEIRHVFNLVTFDIESRTFKIPDALKNSPLDEFYQNQTPALSNAGDTMMRSLWNQVVAGLKNVVYCEAFPGQTQLSNNIDAGFLNFVHVLQEITKVPLPEYPKNQKLGDKTSWVSESLNTIFTFLNPTHQYTFEFLKAKEDENTSNDALKEDFGGDLKVTVLTSDDQILFSFILHIKLGQHGEVQKIMPSHSENDETVKNFMTSFQIRPKNTSEDILALSFPLSDNDVLSRLPLYCQLFRKPLNDNNAKIEFLKLLSDKVFVAGKQIIPFNKNHIPLYQTFLTRVLHTLSWNDRAVVNNVSPILFNLVQIDAFKEVLQNEVKAIALSPELRAMTTLDVSAQQPFPHLEELDLSGGKTTHTLVFSKSMKSLKKIDLEASPIQVIQGLENAPNLEVLNLNQAKNFRKISLTTPMPKLRIISLSGTLIQEIVGLEKASNLEKLILQSAKNLTKLSFSKPMYALKDIDAIDTAISKIQGLEEYVPNLESLSISFPTQFELSKPMKFLKVLYYDGGENTEIQEIQGLKENTPNLEELNIEHAKLKQLNLSNCIKSLKEIELINSEIQEIRGFEENAPNLSMITFYGIKCQEPINFLSMPILAKLFIKDSVFKGIHMLNNSGFPNLKNIAFVNNSLETFEIQGICLCYKRLITKAQPLLSETLFCTGAFQNLRHGFLVKFKKLA